MACQINTVPWINSIQFKKVYECLFSDEITKKRWAIDTISVWETRCHPSLPTAIEATYVLTSAVIQDILWNNKTTLIHHTDLQGIYGSAITRFVSLSVEVNKNRECASYSIAGVAKSIGIPSFIVDVRNEWCHSSRPSLSVLRLAAQSALKYLKESYWEKEVAHVNNFVKYPMDETELLVLLKDYIKFHYDILKSTKVKVIKSDDGTTQTNPEYIMLVRKLDKELRQNRKFFVKILISDGIFIPTDEDLKCVISAEEYTQFNTDYYLDDDDDDDDDENDCEMTRNADDIMKSLQFEATYFPEVPSYHERLWHPVITLLNKYDAVSLFMEELLKSQGDRTIVGQKLLIAWILKILRLHGLTSHPVKSRLLKIIFRQKGIVPNWLSMLYSAVINPSKYTLIILPLILDNLDLEKEITHHIIGLTSLKLGLVPVQNQAKNYVKFFHTADDLKQALEFQRKKEKHKVELKQRNKKEEKKQELSAESIYSFFPDDCHKLWPAGYIVNAVRDEDDVVEEEEIFMCSSRVLSEMSNSQIDFNESMLPSNKNEDEDDDLQPYKMNDEPDLSKIMSEIERRENLLYKR